MQVTVGDFEVTSGLAITRGDQEMLPETCSDSWRLVVTSETARNIEWQMYRDWLEPKWPVDNARDMTTVDTDVQVHAAPETSS